MISRAIYTGALTQNADDLKNNRLILTSSIVTMMVLITVAWSEKHSTELGLVFLQQLAMNELEVYSDD